MTIKCVGCGREIAWDGRGVLCYTCPCGATLFHEADGGIILPASLILHFVEGGSLPHIDYYLGKSAYTSPQKEKAFEFLVESGSVWSWECDECRDRVLEKTKIEVVEGLYPLELHPELKKLVDEMPLPDGYTPSRYTFGGKT